MAVTVVGSQPVIVVKAGDGKGVLVNRDISNAIAIGTSPDIGGGNANNASILDALVGVPLDGTHDYYACTLAQGISVVTDYIPKASNWNPSPAQAAAQINALGLAKDTSVNNPAFGPAKDTSLSTINGTLGAPAQTTDITGVKNAVNNPAFGPAKDTSLSTINGTLGTPAQTADIGNLHSGGTIANEIYATGSNLRHNANNLLNVASQVVAAGATVTVTGADALAIAGTGYTAFASVLCNAAALPPTGTFDLTWSDSTSGKTVWHDTYNFFGGSTSSGSQHFGCGPTKGDTLKIQFTNNDPSHSMTIGFVFTQNSRLYNRDDWRTNAVNTVPGFAAPNRDDTAHLLASFSGNINANTTLTRLIPFYAGKVNVSFQSTTQGGTCDIVCEDPNVVTPSLGTITITGTSAVSLSQEMSLPRSWCIMSLHNTSASAANYTCTIVIAEYLP